MIDSGNIDPGIACATKIYCDPATQQCCITGGGNLQTHMCQGQGDTCGMAGQQGTTMTCDDTADCQAGQVCCGQLDITNTSYLQVTCQMDCSNFNAGQRQFCDPMGNDCVTGTCQASTILPGYHACKP
jgi:hypothetical protein